MFCIVRDSDMPANCSLCPGKYKKSDVCLYKPTGNKDIAIKTNVKTGRDDDCPFRTTDDLIDYLKEHLEDKSNIVEIAKGIKQFFEERESK